MFIAVFGYAAILIGSFPPWGSNCVSQREFGRCNLEPAGGLLNGDPLALVTFLISLTLIVLFLDDHYQYGLVETWRPRKSRLIGLSSVLILGLCIVSIFNKDPPAGWGLLLVALSSMVMLLYSVLMFFLKIGFEKRTGVR